MKIFVGTMYCGEGDYVKCCDAIARQCGGHEIEHNVIANLPEHDAHNALWNEWRQRQSTFDLFVKVDADTVLRDNTTLDKICNCFKGNPRLTGLQAPLYDFFTDSNINGLNCFSPRVIFRDTTDSLYCDRVDTGHDITYRERELSPELVPAGYHCCNATFEQAFHFGLHRALKNQHAIIHRVKSMWLANERDAIRGYVLAGAFSAQRFSQSGFNYADAQFQEAFKRAPQTLNEILNT